MLQVGNFRVEPPGLFRGRGEHPKMGLLKRRIYPRDITINIGEGEDTPEHPYPGQKWKEVLSNSHIPLAFSRDSEGHDRGFQRLVYCSILTSPGSPKSA
jgi:DNA topoisomerase-1